MSTKTRREKRERQRQLAVENDWLWSCPPGIQLAEIADQLGFTAEPQTEFSVRMWADKRMMQDDFFRGLALDYPPAVRLHPLPLDALDDILCSMCTNGRLIVIRDLPSEPPHGVQDLIDIIGFRWLDHAFPSFKSRPGARFAFVLDGWTDTTIRVRTSRTTLYAVNTLESGRPIS